MSKFYFDESVANNVLSGLKNTGNNIQNIRKNLNKAITQLEMCDGFDIVSSMNDVESEMKIMEGISGKADIGKLAIRVALATVQKYENLAVATLKYSYCIENQGNLGNEFKKYKEKYNVFYDEYVDAGLYAKTLWAKGFDSVKRGAKEVFLNLNFDADPGEIYNEYYIAKFMEDMYANVDIPDINGELEKIEDVIKHALSNPGKIGDAELLWNYDIDPESPIGKFITNALNACGDAGEKLGLLSEGIDYVKVISDLVKMQLTDYTKMTAVAENMKSIICEYGSSKLSVLDTIDDLSAQYQMSTQEKINSYLTDFTKGKVVDAFYDCTLGKYTILVEAGGDIIGTFSKDVEAFMEIRYTQDMISGLEKSYEKLSDIINSGNYTSKNLEDYYETFNMLKDTYAYRYERMAIVSGDNTYNDMVDEIRAMSLNYDLM